MQKALRSVELDRELGLTTGREFKRADERDRYCSDGVIASGCRRVEKGGVIRFGGTRWQDDALIPLVGRIVGVHMGDVYCTEINVYWPTYPGGEPLMTVNNYLNTERK